MNFPDVGNFGFWIQLREQNITFQMGIHTSWRKSQFSLGHQGTGYFPWWCSRPPKVFCVPERLWLVWGLLVRPVCRDHWAWEHQGAREWVLQILSFFVPFNFAVVHGHTSGLPRAASLISPAGLLPLEIMRAWTSYQLYQESFFPAKPVRALLSRNLGLKLLFSCFTDDLNEWFTRRVKD